MIEEPTRTINIDGWSMRLRVSSSNQEAPLILMLHGWTGDENAMWVFASSMPEGAVLLAPRGLFSAPLGGYSWHPHKTHSWPGLDDFLPAVEALMAVIIPKNFPFADLSQISLVGFSQGAALAYSLALMQPPRLGKLVGLSGFLPEGVTHLVQNQILLGKSIFIAHGTQDALVPVEKARQAVKQLQQAGALVNYCEHNVGHKLNAACFRSMRSFFEQNP